MGKKTRDAIEILDRLTGDDPELREMIAEEGAAAEQERSELTDEQQEELAQALAEADRSEGVDGWQFLAELRRPPLCPARDSHS